MVATDWVGNRFIHTDQQSQQVLINIKVLSILLLFLHALSSSAANMKYKYGAIDRLIRRGNLLFVVFSFFTLLTMRRIQNDAFLL